VDRETDICVSQKMTLSIAIWSSPGKPKMLDIWAKDIYRDP
jgi:hypothetical protein